MKQTVPERITRIFVSNEIIASEDSDLYVFGLQQGMAMILNIMTSIGIGLFLGMLWQTIIFMLSYIPLRIYAGGYHSKTQFKCYLFSIGLILIGLLTIKFMPWTSAIYIFIWLFSGVIIFYLSPIENSNKPLGQIETSVYRRRALIALGINLLVAIGLYLLNQIHISSCITVALLVLSFMQVLGKLMQKNSQR